LSSKRALQGRVNAQIRKLAALRTDLYYIEVVPSMMQGGKPKALFLSGGLHMTAEGYELWTAAIKPALMSHSDTEQRACSTRIAQGWRQIHGFALPKGRFFGCRDRVFVRTR